jgi:hypothetical protein
MRPSPTAFRDNLKGPLPFLTRVRLFLKNNWRKLRTASTCCGHPGEPGC